MFRSVALLCALTLVACGKTVVVGGGIQLDVTYELRGGTGGCVIVKAVPDKGATVTSQVPLEGEPRTGLLPFAINRPDDWPTGLTILASLHATTCDGPPVVSKTLDEVFPDGTVKQVPMELTEPEGGDGGTGGGAGGGNGAGGGAVGGGAAGGGSTGGGAAGGGATGGGATGGGATGGGATGGGAAGGGAAGGGAAGGGAAGGGAAGGGAAGGGAAGGGAAGGGAAGGGMGGGAAGTCDGGFVVFPEPISGTVNDLAVFAPGSLWIAGAAPKAALRGPELRDGGFVGIGGTCMAPGTLAAIWASSDGVAYFGAGGMGNLFKSGSPDAGCSLASNEVSTAGNITAITGTAKYVYVATNMGHVTRIDVPNQDAVDAQPLLDVEDLVALSDNDVYAVGVSGSGGKGGIAHFDGSNWTTQVAGGGNTSLNAVSFVNPNLGFAAGQVIYRYDGDGGWTGGPGVPCAITGFAATSATDLYAVCGTTSVYHYDGVGPQNGWSPVGTQMGSNFNRIRGTSRCDLWAVGTSGGLLTSSH